MHLTPCWPRSEILLSPSPQFKQALSRWWSAFVISLSPACVPCTGLGAMYLDYSLVLSGLILCMFSCWSYGYVLTLPGGFIYKVGRMPFI